MRIWKIKYADGFENASKIRIYLKMTPVKTRSTVSFKII